MHFASIKKRKTITTQIDCTPHLHLCIMIIINDINRYERGPLPRWREVPVKKGSPKVKWGIVKIKLFKKSGTVKAHIKT